MSDNPDISSCANPKCGSEFKRLGEGRLAVYLVDDPVAWGLPEHIKQKALWLCDACDSQMYIRLDRRRHVVRFVRKLPAQDSKTA